MDKVDAPKYLANIMAVSRIDAVLAPAEEAALELVQSEIGAKKRDLKAAEKLLAHADYLPEPVGRFSDRVRNLEDMALVAASDGDVAEAEQEILAAFAQAAGVTPEQLGLITEHAQTRAVLGSGSAKCPACQGEVPQGSKFCPHCGARFD